MGEGQRDSNYNIVKIETSLPYARDVKPTI